MTIEISNSRIRLEFFVEGIWLKPEIPTTGYLTKDGALMLPTLPTAAVPFRHPNHPGRPIYRTLQSLTAREELPE